MSVTRRVFLKLFGVLGTATAIAKSGLYAVASSMGALPVLYTLTPSHRVIVREIRLVQCGPVNSKTALAVHMRSKKYDPSSERVLVVTGAPLWIGSIKVFTFNDGLILDRGSQLQVKCYPASENSKFRFAVDLDEMDGPMPGRYVDVSHMDKHDVVHRSKVGLS